MTLDGVAVDRALGAMGDFADLTSPFLVGHAAGVSELAAAAAQHCQFSTADVVVIRRAALVHDIGRVAVPTRIWQKPDRLTPDEWEGSGCTRITPIGSSAPQPFSRPLRQWRWPTMNVSTVRVIRGERLRRRCPTQLDSWRLPMPTTR